MNPFMSNSRRGLLELQSSNAAASEPGRPAAELHPDRAGLASLIAVAAVLICTITAPAHAQIQPGPNLTASGRPFLYAPRAGYLGPPIAVHSALRAPWPIVYPRTGAPSIPAWPAALYRGLPPPPPPPPPPVVPPEPSAFAQGWPPVALPRGAATQAHPPRNKPASGLRERPPFPCPDGCPREPDDDEK
jgi:hypothetical protein